MTEEKSPAVNPIYPKEHVKTPAPVPGIRLIENVYVHVIAQGHGAGLSQGQWQWFGTIWDSNIAYRYDCLYFSDMADEPHLKFCRGVVAAFGAGWLVGVGPKQDFEIPEGLRKITL